MTSKKTPGAKALTTFASHVSAKSTRAKPCDRVFDTGEYVGEVEILDLCSLQAGHDGPHAKQIPIEKARPLAMLNRCTEVHVVSIDERGTMKYSRCGLPASHTGAHEYREYQTTQGTEESVRHLTDDPRRQTPL